MLCMLSLKHMAVGQCRHHVIQLYLGLTDAGAVLCMLVRYTSMTPLCLGFQSAVTDDHCVVPLDCKNFDLAAHTFLSQFYLCMVMSTQVMETLCTILQGLQVTLPHHRHAGTVYILVGFANYRIAMHAASTSSQGLHHTLLSPIAMPAQCSLSSRSALQPPCPCPTPTVSLPRSQCCVQY